MINHVIISFSTIQICDISYIHFYNTSNIFACVWLVYICHMSAYSLAKAGEYSRLYSIKYFPHALLVECVTWPEFFPAKTGEYPRIFPNFQNCVRYEKELMDNKHNSFHLGQKYAEIFVLRLLFLKAHSFAHSFPRAMLSENCLLLGTDNVRGQIY